MKANSTIFVVDDNPETRRALERLLESADLSSKTYSSAQEFLDSYDRSWPGCLLLDIRMPGISGLELQEKLVRDQIRIPVIIVSAHGEVKNVVRAIKTGAVDFIKKPYRGRMLLERVHQALELDTRFREEEAARVTAAARLALLTSREREVMDLLVAGCSAKQIAQELSLARTTVDTHRSHIMTKLQASSLVELIHIAQLCGTGAQVAARKHAATDTTRPSADSVPPTPSATPPD